MPATKTEKKPFLFFTALPAEGHANPLLKVAHGLIARGYDAVFHCSADFEPKIRAIGAEFAEAPPLLTRPTIFDEINALPPYGFQRNVFALSEVFLKTLPARADSVGAALARLRAREGPDRQIIVMTELCALGVAPFVYGRPPPPGFERDGFPRVIGLSAMQLAVRSRDTAPYILGLPFDNTESGRLRNAMFEELLLGPGGPMHPIGQLNAEMLRAAGADEALIPREGHLTDSWFQVPEVALQMCLPEQEYPLSDLSEKIKFVGCLPRREPRPDDPLPGWWAEVLENGERRAAAAGGGGAAAKKLVFVCQGTVAVDHRQLVIPTLDALAGRDDVLVAAALGAKGAALPPDYRLPANARVVDYLPYDTILKHADVMVSNAGYGALCHAVVNGVPLVLAGESEDKKEATMRATWAGYAVGLWTQQPTAEQVREGVEEVLRDGKYRKRAMELRVQNEKMGCLDKIEGWVEEFTAKE